MSVNQQTDAVAMGQLALCISISFTSWTSAVSQQYQPRQTVETGLSMSHWASLCKTNGLKLAENECAIDTEQHVQQRSQFKW